MALKLVSHDIMIKNSSRTQNYQKFERGEVLDDRSCQPFSILENFWNNAIPFAYNTLRIAKTFLWFINKQRPYMTHGEPFGFNVQNPRFVWNLRYFYVAYIETWCK